METSEVVIAGAGIIGLSLALDLVTHGLNVTVLERGRAMSESSWAAAGMLAGKDPENPPQLAELASLSLALYPDFLARVEQLSGKKVPLRSNAAIQAVTSNHATQLIATRKLTRSELHSIVPDLVPQYEHFLLIEESSLDPRDLCAALPAAAIASGVQLLEDAPVISLDAKTARIVVQTPKTAISTTHFVNCTGAWAGSPALSFQTHDSIFPAKGQIATVRLRGHTNLTHVLRTPEIYLVPRGDGRITIGATVEQAGFDKTVEPRAIDALLKAAANLWPPIAGAEILESWVGLRPGSSDELPLIGPTSHANSWIASGHFRNGILLAPGTAHVLSQLIRGERPSVDLTPFRPARSIGDRPLPLPAALPI